MISDFQDRRDAPRGTERQLATTQSDSIEHNVRHTARIEQRIEAIKTAVPFTTDPGVVVRAMTRVQTLFVQLTPLLDAIAQYDARSAELCATLTDLSNPRFAARRCKRLRASLAECVRAKIATASRRP